MAEKMTDQQLIEAYNSMPRKDFEKVLANQGLVLTTDTAWKNGSEGESSPPMDYAETPQFDGMRLRSPREKRSPLWLYNK